MVPKILITGAAGYIGGTLLVDLLATDNTLPNVSKENITVVVRSEEQIQALSKLGVNVVRLDLDDKNAVIETVLSNNIDIVIHTASSINPDLALPWITALGKRRELSREQKYFVHTSGLSAFFQRMGWPDKVMKDTDPIFETEKRLADTIPFPLRKVDVAVVEHAQAEGVTSYTVVPSVVYGKGRGVWNQLSVVVPPVVRAAIASKTVHRFSENATTSGVHVSDLSALYGLIIDKILNGENIPDGPEGYYIAIAHDFSWWEVLDRLAIALHSRGLVDSPEVQTWPSIDVAAQSLEAPRNFVEALWNSGEKIVIERPQSIGWKPEWTKERFLQEINNEIVAVEELGYAKSSLMESLKNDKRL